MSELHWIFLKYAVCKIKQNKASKHSNSTMILVTYNFIFGYGKYSLQNPLQHKEGCSGGGSENISFGVLFIAILVR